MMKFIEHRIADEKMLRLIRKWLSAGVIEEGVWTETTEGVPQGASISCLLANIYLHYVFDLWTQQWRRKHASGDVIAVRYADDVALGFQHEEEARKYTTELGERLSRFGLMLHADKTRRLRFGNQAEQQRKRRGERKPETFHFLGFNHICGRDRRGRFALQRRTGGKRQRAKLREVKKELLQRRHLPIPEQGEWLASVIRGHAAYYAVPNNGDRVYAFKSVAQRHWYRALQRRSQRSRLSWAKMQRLIRHCLPQIRIMHPWPEERFIRQHPR